MLFEETNTKELLISLERTFFFSLSGDEEASWWEEKVCL